ncbi:MAG: hypothetical protein FJ271_15095 [Planctomycetes bacterium]|nr:hypothetical protein [Planctomycetota bacterium]
MENNESSMGKVLAEAFGSLFTLVGITAFCMFNGCGTYQPPPKGGPIPVVNPTNGDVGMLTKNSVVGEWRGMCAQPNFAPYPMIMSMSATKGSEISGTIHWPTLRNSTTRFSGTIYGTKVRFVETELLSGSGIGIPCIYEGDVLGNTIAGTCIHAEQKATFSVSMAAR